MADTPTSPFSGLDKALLRSTGQASVAPASQSETPSAEQPKAVVKQPAQRTRDMASPKARNTAITDESKIASKQASKIASMPELVQAIRKIVRTPGREVSYVRLTPTEKGELADIIYGLKRRGHKTTETEINRIAVNFIINDYKQNGEQSILASVLNALQA